MTIDELKRTADILTLAGSETTATVLSGATYLLLVNPLTLSKATREVRHAFKNPQQINFASVQNSTLPYMNACLEEALRRYPPIAGILFRRVGADGEVISGDFVPPNVKIFALRVPFFFFSLFLTTDDQIACFRQPWASASTAPTTRPETLRIQTASFPSAGWATSATGAMI